jgi:hypothetical protein
MNPHDEEGIDFAPGQDTRRDPGGIRVEVAGDGLFRVVADGRHVMASDIENALMLHFDITGAAPLSKDRAKAILRRLAHGPDAAGPRPPLTVDAWQEGCTETAVYPNAGNCQLYPLLGMVDELGEAIRALDGAIERAFPTAEVDREPPVVVVLLRAAATLGEVAGTLKKAWRNTDGDRAGTIEPAARQRAIAAVSRARHWSDILAYRLGYWQNEDRVQLPPLDPTTPEWDKFAAEMGDVSWYFAQSMSEFDMCADSVIRSTLAKLRERRDRGTLRSTGDDEATRPSDGAQ